MWCLVIGEYDADTSAEKDKNMSFVRDLRVAAHSLIRTPGLAVAVVLTLALGIGANAAIFTLVRGVLLKPLVNRDEGRLIYIRQSAPGIGDVNSTFSVPEIQDLRASVKTLSVFGDFSTMDFTMIGLGEPRSIRGGVVGGNYFEVMGTTSRARPPHRTAGRRTDSRRRGRSHLSLLDDESAGAGSRVVERGGDLQTWRREGGIYSHHFPGLQENTASPGKVQYSWGVRGISLGETKSSFGRFQVIWGDFRQTF